MALIGVPCVIMRGGTSKGIFFKRENLPEDNRERDKIILKIFGSGDPIQIDGLGGAYTVTSKTMIVWKSKKRGIDVEYLFGQVGIEKYEIDYSGNCGNLTSAVAPFAIDEGLVEVQEPCTRVRMYNVNTDKRVDAIVPVENGATKYEGNYYIDGVPNPGARIDVIWHDPSGSMTGKLLPTGNPKDFININDKIVEISIVDAANPAVFVKAEELGLRGDEHPSEIPAQKMQIIEKIRSTAAKFIGLVETEDDATIKSPHFPFIALVSSPKTYKTTKERIIDKSDYTILARLFSLQKMHHAYPVTGAICTAIASKIPGTVVNDVAVESEEKVIIGHPKGILEVGVKAKEKEKHVYIESVTISRTARRLMAGIAYYLEP
ncbi:3-methylitaconate isomerase [Archaeoglobales archaeon]|nr:MAG: 3-methylitaconate isomerase [Archaeoglobales archaeon]